MTKDAVYSAKQWLELPEPVFPILKSNSESGSVCHVRKVGFYLAPDLECHKNKIIPRLEVGGMYVLPTSFIEEGEENVLYRLPLELSDWVVHNVTLAHSGMNVFPNRVKFGELNGRKYAELD